MKIINPETRIMRTMFVTENWMFQLDLSYCQIFVFSYVYNCIKCNAWNPKDISCVMLAGIMNKTFQYIHNCLKELCNKGLLVQSGYTASNCSIYSLTPKVFEVSTDIPVTEPTPSPTTNYQPVYDKFTEVLGGEYIEMRTIVEWAEPLLQRDYTIQNMVDVIEAMSEEWKGKDWFQNIRPQTLFNLDPDRFPKYLQTAKMKLYNPERLARIEYEKQEQEERKKKEEERKEYQRKVQSGEIKVYDYNKDPVKVLVYDLYKERGFTTSTENNLRLIVKNLQGCSEDKIREIFDSSPDFFTVFKKSEEFKLS